ncbi:MAG: sulfotransferase family protein [Phycisphaeraceae bacterium]|nr:MAG: sulfotransferase family protein [Phycisphaeraceae bacterium]
MAGIGNAHPLTRVKELQRGGHLIEAADLCRRILKKERKNLDAIYTLGVIMFELGVQDEAEQLFKKCLAARPGDARLQFRLAQVAEIQGKGQEAIARCKAALQIDPDHENALALMASTHERNGDLDKARAVLAPRLEKGGMNGSLAIILARIETSAKNYDEALRIVGEALESGELNRSDRIELLNKSVKALDKKKAYDDAFAACRQSNELAGAAFDPEEYVRNVDRLLETFSRENLAKAPRPGVESELPVIIAGMPRSGTTLVEQVIDAHPKAHGAGEFGDFKLFGAFHEYPQWLAQLGQEELDRHAREAIAYYRNLGGGAARVVNKSLSNVVDLGLLSLIFPKARVIRTRRDPMDNCLSIYMQSFNPEKAAFAFDQRHLGLYYRQHERIMDHWQNALDLPIYEVRYEEVVADQERISRELIEFLGLEWDDACLKFYEKKRTVMTLSYDQVNKPIYTSSVERWRNYEKHLGPLKEALGVG